MIALSIDGESVPFRSLRILQTVNALATGLSAVVAPPPQKPLEHALLEVNHDGLGRVFRGRIELVTRSFSSNGVEISVEARCALGLLVDCYVEKSKEFCGAISASLILDEIFGGFEASHQGFSAFVLEGFQVQAGQKIGDLIGTLSRQANVLPTSNRLGSLQPFKVQRNSVLIAQGQQVIAAQTRLNVSKTFSRTTFSWQRSFLGPEPEKIVVQNPAARIFRPRFTVLPRGTSKDAAQRVLDWEVRAQEFAEKEFALDLTDWSSSGRLWSIGQPITLDLPALEVTKSTGWVVVGVDFLADDHRLTTRLKLAREDSLLQGKEKEKKRDMRKEFGFPRR